ncbi:MAG: hypothetical protein BGO98_12930 [Myxococcales bacterium 68-20]|nr:hypothetical protein [Myxococcales bacterium]OJY17056.1 MAG: hypothetical protein BGO98_12930 [Myxococcales bacterium 68-20]
MRTPRGALPCDWRFGTSVALLVVGMACGGGVERPPAPEDGSLAMSVLGEPGAFYWSPSGEHIALIPWQRETRRVTGVDVERAPRRETSRPCREIAEPGGTTFDVLAEQSAISGATVSSDGRWILFIAKGATESLDAFSTTGDGTVRPLSGCASPRDADSRRRAGRGAGTSERATLGRERSGSMVTRSSRGARTPAPSSPSSPSPGLDGSG